MASLDLTPGTHNFKASNGITYHYIIGGNGPLVVWQSVGWGASIDLYKNTMQELEAEFTMLYFETRGIGGGL